MLNLIVVGGTFITATLVGAVSVGAQCLMTRPK